MAYSVTLPTRSVTPVVTIDGIELQNVVSASVRFALDQPVPTANVTVAGQLPAWISRGAAVTITFEERLFTGTVKRRQRQVGQSTIQCVGKTQILWQPFRTSGWLFGSVTAQAAVETILDDLGLTDRSIDMVAWTIGAVQTAVLDLTTPGDAVQRIIEVDGHRMFETPSGTLVIRPLLTVPAPAAFRTYTTTGSAPWVVDISDDEDEDQVKKEVWVSGANLGGEDAEGNADSTQVKARAYTTDDSLVAGDPELYSMNYQNELIETEAKAASVALRLLDKHHRILERISMTVPLDPDIMLAMTLGITDVAITGRTVRWFVEGYSHSFSNGSCDTTLELVGGDQSGTTGFIDPLADFRYIIERELLGNEWRAVVTFISTSRDLDGTITNYHWTDDYTPVNDETGADLETVQFIYDPDVSEFITMTLEVTDDDGLTGSVIKTIFIGVGPYDEKYVPNVSCAAYAGVGEAMHTPDGGFTWRDQGGLAGNTISVTAATYAEPAAPTIIVFGTDTGRLYRSTDGLATAPALVFTEPAASAINDLWWSTDPARLNEVWAVTQNGRLYRSQDDGATWVLYHDFGGAYPLNDIATPPDMVFVFGGRGDDPDTWIRFTLLTGPAGTWYTPDMSGATPSAAADTIRNVAANDATEFLLLFTGTRDPALIYTEDLWATPVVWTNGVGLDAGLEDGRMLAPNSGLRGSFLAGFDNKEMWTTGDGVNWETTVPRLSTPDQPTLALGVGTLPTATYSYRISAINLLGETLAGPNNTIAIIGPAGVDVSWPAVTGATGYRVYGRTSGSEEFMVEVATTSWTDDGSVVPSGALPAVNSTAWVLPGTAANEPWHLFNVPGIPNLYFGASDEGIFKTTTKASYGQFGDQTPVTFLRPATGISTWPVSALGRMVTYVALAEQANAEPDEVYLIINDPDDFSIRKLLRRDESGVWSLVNAVLSGSAVRLKIFRFVSGNVRFFHTQFDDGAHWGTLRRSIDDGVTFADVLVRCSAIVQSPDNSLWALQHAATNGPLGDPDHWYAMQSIDEGATWAQIAEISIDEGAGNFTPLTAIDVHPQNPLYIFATGRLGLSGIAHAISLNGGSTWTLRAAGARSPGGEEFSQCLWVQNNRILVVQNTSPDGPHTSDDFGVSFAQKYDSGPEWWAQLVRAGMALFAHNPRSAGTDRFRRSLDNGETWEDLSTLLPESPGTGGGAYHPSGSRLYATVERVVATNDVAVFRLMPATSVDPSSDWAEITGNLYSVIANPREVQQGIAVRP